LSNNFVTISKMLQSATITLKGG